MVLRRVMFDDIVLNDPKDFAAFVNKVAHIKSLYLASEEVLKEPRI